MPQALNRAQKLHYFFYLIAIFLTLGVSLTSFYTSGDHPFARNISKIDPRTIFILSLLLFPSAVFILVRQKSIQLISLLPVLWLVIQQGVLLELTYSLIHAGAIFIAGIIASKYFLQKTDSVSAYFLGFICVTVFYIIFSVFKLLNFYPLLILDILILAFGSFLFFAKKLSVHFSDKSQMEKYFPLIIYIVLLLAVRSDAISDHDPTWYSFGWIENLSANSLWSRDGFINSVHHYGKIQELSVGWLGFYNSPASEIFFTSFFLIAAAFYVLSEFKIEKTSFSFLLWVLLFGTPVAFGTASTGKADVLPLASIAIFLSIILTQKQSKNFFLMMICLAVFLTSKPTYIIWGGFFTLLFLGNILSEFRHRRHIPAILASAFVVIAFWGRTYLNTGYFYTGIDFFVELQALIGLAPINGLVNTDLGTLGLKFNDFWQNVFAQFFDPGTKGQYGLSWAGISIFISALYIALNFRQFRLIQLIRIGLVLAFLLFLIGGISGPSQTLDGFYIYPAFLYLCLEVFNFENGKDRVPNKWAFLPLIFISLLSFVICLFYSSWRVNAFHSLKLTSLPSAENTRYENFEHMVMGGNSMLDIASFIEAEKGNCKTLVLASTKKSIWAWYSLNCPIETIQNVTWQMPLSKELFVVPDTTKAMITFSKTKFLAIEKDFKNLAKIEGLVMNDLNGTIVIDNDRWKLYKIGLANNK